jgi:hypothetical protein
MFRDRYHCTKDVSDLSCCDFSELRVPVKEFKSYHTAALKVCSFESPFIVAVGRMKGKYNKSRDHHNCLAERYRTLVKAKRHQSRRYKAE